MTELLCDLPDSVSCTILCSWVDLKSLVRLDSALCSAPLKSNFDHLLRSKEFKIIESMDITHHSCTSWLLRKDIRIENIELGYYDDDNPDWKILRRNGDFIRSVHLNCSTEARIYLIAIYCKSLKALRFVENEDTTLAFRELMRCNEKLEELRLDDSTADDWHLFNDDSFLGIKRLAIVGGIPSFPWKVFVGSSLEQLDLVDLDEDITTKQFKLIADLCPNLRTVGLRKSYLGDADVVALISNCSKIVNLDLTDNESITDDAVERIVKLLPGLRTLHLCACMRLTFHSLDHIRAHCANLTYLSFDLYEDGLEAFSNVLSHCKQLHTLAVSYLADTSKFEHVLTRMGSIRKLQLGGVLGNNDALCLVGKHCKALEHLDISFCQGTRQLTTAHSALAQGCPHLTELVLPHGAAISSTVLASWRSLRPQLRVTNRDKNYEYMVFEVDAEQQRGEGNK